MRRTRALVAVCCMSGLLLQACARPAPAPQAELRVAAACDLMRALDEIAVVWQRIAGVRIVPDYASTGHLAQKMSSGAPYDLLLAEDLDHVDRLIRSGVCLADSRALYARGHLVLWATWRHYFRLLDEITGPDVHGIVVASPEFSPYGAATIDAMKNAGYLDKLPSGSITYVPDVAAAKTIVDHWNADAAFTALSLIIDQTGNYFLIDDRLHQPLDQALCVAKNAKDPAAARRFAQFLESDAGYSILQRYGYGRP